MDRKYRASLITIVVPGDAAPAETWSAGTNLFPSSGQHGRRRWWGGDGVAYGGAWSFSHLLFLILPAVPESPWQRPHHNQAGEHGRPALLQPGRPGGWQRGRGPERPRRARAQTTRSLQEYGSQWQRLPPGERPPPYGGCWYCVVVESSQIFTRSWISGGERRGSRRAPGGVGQKEEVQQTPTVHRRPQQQHASQQNTRGGGQWRGPPQGVTSLRPLLSLPV